MAVKNKYLIQHTAGLVYQSPVVHAVRLRLPERMGLPSTLAAAAAGPEHTLRQRDCLRARDPHDGYCCARLCACRSQETLRDFACRCCALLGASRPSDTDNMTEYRCRAMLVILPNAGRLSHSSGGRLVLCHVPVPKRIY